MPDQLSKQRRKIMDLGGNPRLVAEELANTAITVTPAVTTNPPPNPSNPVIQMNPTNPAPSPAPVIAPTPMVAPATPLVASEAIIFRPISPPTGVSRHGQPMRDHVTPPWIAPPNLSRHNLPEGWTYTEYPHIMNYGYGPGIVPPQDPIYVQEWRRRTEEWYEEVIRLNAAE
ncbi:hypothetical protein V8E54_008415 [Elaphomyces granulatus]